MNYKKWLKEQSESYIYDFLDKPKCVDNHISYQLMRTQRMFEYSGLPETVPALYAEKYLQLNGFVCVARCPKDDKIYAFFGGLGGQLDEYYFPTICTVSNPYLGFSENYKIGENCVIVPNDSYYAGLLPMFSKYATQLTENEISIYDAMLNSRIQSLISASDDATKASADKFLDDVKAGRLGTIAESAFLDGIRAQPYGGSGAAQTLQNLIELEQYIKASWYNDIGLNANYNMKRESLNSNESQLNDDALLPLIDDMLKCRQDGWNRVNKMFGTNISVKLASSWEDNAEEIALKHDEMYAAGTGAEEEEEKRREENAETANNG